MVLVPDKMPIYGNRKLRPGMAEALEARLESTVACCESETVAGSTSTSGQGVDLVGGRLERSPAKKKEASFLETGGNTDDLLRKLQLSPAKSKETDDCDCGEGTDEPVSGVPKLLQSPSKSTESSVLKRREDSAEPIPKLLRSPPIHQSQKSNEDL